MLVVQVMLGNTLTSDIYNLFMSSLLQIFKKKKKSVLLCSRNQECFTFCINIS